MSNMAKKELKKQKREEKFSQIPISAYHSMYSVTRLLTYWRSMKVGWSYIWTIFINFFVLQFLQVVGIKKIPVVNVEHPLDYKIPFVPEKIAKYLFFVRFHLRPPSMLIKRYGIKKAVPYCNEWFSALKKAYYSAGQLYKIIMSTTPRPEYKENKNFKMIHRWDPHLLCVPSLHIAIILIVVAEFKKLSKVLKFSEAESFQKNTEVYTEAIAIAESVLYVKQHSVNCVPAAIYMVTKLYPDIFTPNDAVNFINDLFLSSDVINPEDVAKIKEYILFMYERFLLEGYASDDWREPIIHWISSYKKD